MLEELFNLVKEASGQTVVNNPDVPNEYNNDVMAEATNTVAGGLRNMVAGGGLQNIVSLFTGHGQSNNSVTSKTILSNPIVNMMIGHFAGKLTTKYNMQGAQANNVAGSLIPDVLSNLINKSNDPANNGFSLEGLLNSITGGQTTQVIQEQQNGSNSGFNFQDLIGQFTGGGKQNGGGGLMDIVSRLAGGAQNQQQRNGGGGLMDLIKGFIK